jgi:hypothetical protein
MKSKTKKSRCSVGPEAREIEQLAITSARTYEPLIRADAERMNVPLPLDDANINHLLDQTLEGLRRQGLVPWWGISSDKRQLFTETWATEMTRLGLRS